MANNVVLIYGAEGILKAGTEILLALFPSARPTVLWEKIPPVSLFSMDWNSSWVEKVSCEHSISRFSHLSKLTLSSACILCGCIQGEPDHKLILNDSNGGLGFFLWKANLAQFQNSVKPIFFNSSLQATKHRDNCRERSSPFSLLLHHVVLLSPLLVKCYSGWFRTLRWRSVQRPDSYTIFQKDHFCTTSYCPKQNSFTRKSQEALGEESMPAPT